MDKLGAKGIQTPPAAEPVDVSNYLLFEVCSEIGRQVGGIHTVLKTKAPIETRKFGDRYTLVGRLDSQSAAGEFDKLQPPTDEMKGAMEALHGHGVETFYGKWLEDGSPRVLLIDVESASGFFDGWKRSFEGKTGVELPCDDEMSDDALRFGYLATWFFREFLSREKKRAVVAQYHEWPSALGCYLSEEEHLPMATIFTAHATVLGRDLSDRGADLYRDIESIDPAAEARTSSVAHRHAIERLAARSCTILTTVSDVTSLECARLLSRAADAVLPNGMNTASASPAGESPSAAALRYAAKLKIRDFLRGHFYGQLGSFDTGSALYFFLAGRYEYANKGVDMYIEALARLNEWLRREGEGAPTVVAFIVVPAGVESISTEALHRQATVKTIGGAVGEIERGVGHRLRERALAWRRGDALPTEAELVTGAEHAALRRCLYGVQTHDLPPLATHNIASKRDDPIVQHLRRAGLCNAVEDRVKVVFHPDFLHSSSSIFPIDYESFVRGAHLGVFPSAYEPWGYTPAECLVRGVPALTSNVSGFGDHMERLLRDVSAADHGLYIVDRRTGSWEEAAAQTAEYMHAFCGTSRKERAAQRNRADKLGEFLDWEELHGAYGRARRMALLKRYGGDAGAEEKVDGRAKLPQIRQRSELSLSFAPTPVVEE